MSICWGTCTTKAKRQMGICKRELLIFHSLANATHIFLLGKKKKKSHLHLLGRSKVKLKHIQIEHIYLQRCSLCEQRQSWFVEAPKVKITFHMTNLNQLHQQQSLKGWTLMIHSLFFSLFIYFHLTFALRLLVYFTVCLLHPRKWL